jgi:3-keto-disaccharide hydrolase
MDWPRLRVWTNGELIQDVDLAADPLFRNRLRRGYVGFASLSYPIQFRNLTIEELPGKESWQSLYTQPADFEGWFITDGKPHFEAIGEVLRGDGVGHFATREKFKDFELRMYVRAMREHNSGVLFRSDGKGNKGVHYEIQLHNVEDAHYPTGSLYHFKRASYPRIEPDVWFPLQMIVKGPSCLVRINGDTVLEYDQLETVGEGHIELQAHRLGYWTEFKQIRVKRL